MKDAPASSLPEGPVDSPLPAGRQFAGRTLGPSPSMVDEIERLAGECRFLGLLPKIDFARTAELLVGIPAINRVDLLEEAILSIDHAADVVVVCNSVEPRFCQPLCQLAQRLRIGILPQRRNVGVAAGWNTILRYGLRNGYPRMLITAADVRHKPGAIARTLAQGVEHPGAVVWRLNHYNSFVLSPRTVAHVGFFDENFYPGYFEDNDYERRRHLAGFEDLRMPEGLVHHGHSMTIRSDRGYARGNDATFSGWNANHYICKWGGPPGAETHVTPYGRADKDLRWWPDPAQTIDRRDWDLLIAAEDGLPLAMRYAEVCRTPSDLWEHCPVLYAYARRSGHVTEFGASKGVSTTALLAAQPLKLVTHDLVKHPNQTALEKIAGRTTFVFKTADVLKVDVEPTDLLYIDTRHTFRQLTDELRRHARKTRRWIILHDTTTFGHKDEGDGGGPGLWPAVEAFLGANGSWRIKARYENNNGLTVLERT